MDGEKLALLRKRKGITQEELSELLGITNVTLSRWENGHFEPKASTVKTICKVLDCSETELLNGPQKNEWELKLIINKKGDKNMNTSVINLTGETSAATLELSDNAMGITLSAGYDLWEDEEKFEALIEQIRKKRNIGLKTRREDW